MKKNSVLAMLEGGDRRSIGRADEVAALVLRSPRLFGALVKGLWSEKAVVRMRAADAAEKVTRTRPEWLATYKKELLGLLREAEEQEVRWHLTMMVPRLELDAKDRGAAMEALREYLEDKSSIVKTCALEGLAELAGKDVELRAGVVEILREATRSGTAAMRARGRKLLLGLENRKRKIEISREKKKLSPRR
jgi:hypothetical protein